MHVLIAVVAETEGGGEKISPILAPYPGLMFWTIVAFLLAMYVLKRFAFGPIQAALDKRRDAVNGALDRAEQMQAESEAVLADYRQQLANARVESESIVERARKAGDELTARIKAEGENQRQENLAATRQQMQSEVEKAIEDIRTAVAEMTVQAAERVLRGTIDQAQHQRLIEQAVEELDFDRLQKVGSSS